MHNQVYVFLIFILNGFLIGLLFDTFRILRKSFKTSNIITNIQDIIFWILSGLLSIYSIFKFTDGTLRIYIFLGILLGYILYLLIFSKIYIGIFVYILTFIKKLLYFIIIVPFSFILRIISKIIFRPLKFIFDKIFVRISDFLKKSAKKVIKNIFSKKNQQEKKDFA
jgi:spore cortex biosynthesis protein YabQ